MMMAPASPPPPPWRWQADATAGLASPSPGYGALPPGASPGGGIGDGGGAPGGGATAGLSPPAGAPPGAMGIGLRPAPPPSQGPPAGGPPAPATAEGASGTRPLVFGAEESNAAWKHVKKVIGDDGRGAPDLHSLLSASPLEGGYAFHQAGVSARRPSPPSLNPRLFCHGS